MKKDKGIAYCGLACCMCSENETCAGCRNDGCKDKEWCKNFKCCKQKGIQGCWECEKFPCAGGMLDNVRIRTFSTFVARYGAEKLMDCLEQNEQDGMIYHYEGLLIGDYDVAENEEGIMELILQGKKGDYDGRR